MALHCRCGSLLASVDILRIHSSPGNNGINVCICPTNLLEATNVGTRENDDKRQRNFAPQRMTCRSCGGDVGTVTNRDCGGALYCFSCTKTSFVKSDGTSLKAKKWGLLAPELRSQGVAALSDAQLLNMLGAAPRPSAAGKPRHPTVFCDPATLTDAAIHRLTSCTPRDYQVEMTRAALSSNSLICLPTGTGKTLIACAVVHAMLRLNPRKMAVFAVHTVALVDQQARQLEAQIPNVTVRRAHGQMLEGNNKTAKVVSRCGTDVLVATGQLVNNWLTPKEDGSATLRMCDVCCLVLDEAHHAWGDSPYAILMSQHYEGCRKSGEEYRPLVMGMTASPMNSKEPCGQRAIASKLEELKQILQCCMCHPQHSAVYNHVPLPRLQCIVRGLSVEEQSLKERVESYLGSVLRITNGLLGEQRLASVSVANSNKLRGLVRAKKRDLNRRGGVTEDSLRGANAVLGHMSNVLCILEVNAVIGCGSAVRELHKLFKEIDHEHATPTKRLIRGILKDSQRELCRFVDCKVSSNGAWPSSASEVGNRLVSPKCKALADVLEEFARSEGDVRAIVFVEMRRTARKLKECLDLMYPKIRQCLNPKASFCSQGVEPLCKL